MRSTFRSFHLSKAIYLCLLLTFCVEMMHAQNVLPIRTNGKWGLIDREGNVLLSTSFEYIGEYEKGLAVFKKGKVYGLLDTLYQPIIPAQFEDIRLADGYALVAKDARWGVYRSDGKELIAPRFHSLGDAGNGYFKTWKDRLAGLCDSAGQQILPNKYVELSMLSPQYIQVWDSDTTTGIVDTKAQEILPSIYEDVRLIDDLGFVFESNQLLGMTNIAGKEVLEPIFEEITPYVGQEGERKEQLPFVVLKSQSGMYGVFDVEKEQFCLDTLYRGEIRYLGVKTWVADHVSFRRRVLHHEEKGVLVKGIREVEFLGENLVKVQLLSRLWGVYSLQASSWMISPEYRSITLDQGRFRGIGKEGKRFALPLRAIQLDSNRRFKHYSLLAEGIWGVYDGNQWGMMNSTGKVILKPTVRQLFQFEKGFPVSIYRKRTGYGLIRIDGRILTPAIYLFENIALYPDENKVKLTRPERKEGLILTFNKEGEIMDRLESRNMLSISIKKQDRVQSRRFMPTGIMADTTVRNRQASPVEEQTRRQPRPRLVEYEKSGGLTYWYLGDVANRAIWRAKDRVKRRNEPDARIRPYPLPLDADSARVIRLSFYKPGIDAWQYVLLHPNGSKTYRYMAYDARRRKERMQAIGYIGPFKEGIAIINIGGSSDSSIPRNSRATDFVGSSACTGGKWGVINGEGEMTIKPLYDKMQPFENGSSIVLKGEKWGVIDRNGSVVIDCKYDLIQRIGANREIFLLISEQQKYGYIDSLGHEVIPVRFTDIGLYQEDGWIAAAQRKKNRSYWGFVDSKGDWLIEPQFMAAATFQEGLAPVQDTLTRKWGYIDYSGKWVIEPTLRDARGFSNGKAYAKAWRGGYGYLNKQGEWIVSPQFNRVESLGSGFFCVRPYGKKYGVINEQGEWILRPKYYDITKTDDYFIVRKSRQRRGIFSSKTGKWLVRGKFREIGAPSEGLFMAKKSTKYGGYKNYYYGYIDTLGETAIEFKYLEATPFQEGKAIAQLRVNERGDAVQKEDRYINPQGEALITGLQGGEPFKEGKALVYLHRNRFGERSAPQVIQADGKVKFEMPYRPLGSFSQGRMPVEWGKKQFFIDSMGYALPIEGQVKSDYQHSVAWMGNGDKLQLIDLAGLPVSADYYSESATWSGGVARVAVSQLMGLANAQGEEIEPVVYSKITPLGKGMICLEKEGSYYYYHLGNHQWIWREK